MRYNIILHPDEAMYKHKKGLLKTDESKKGFKKTVDKYCAQYWRDVWDYFSGDISKYIQKSSPSRNWLIGCNAMEENGNAFQ